MCKARQRQGAFLARRASLVTTATSSKVDCRRSTTGHLVRRSRTAGYNPELRLVSPGRTTDRLNRRSAATARHRAPAAAGCSPRFLESPIVGCSQEISVVVQVRAGGLKECLLEWGQRGLKQCLLRRSYSDWAGLRVPKDEQGWNSAHRQAHSYCKGFAGVSPFSLLRGLRAPSLTPLLPEFC